jgi:RHS repeat-associated protein
LCDEGRRSRSTGKERDAETGLDFFEARYFSGAQGRFTSPDPFNIITRAENQDQFETYLSQPQNWNAYVYTWNNPLRYTDPTGESVYVIAYTVGNESGDEEFKRVAETRANEIRNAKGFDPKKDTVLVRGIKSFDDLKGLVKEANALDKSFGKVGELSIVSHAGQDGPNFNYGHNRSGGPRYTNEQNPSGIASLTVNWDSSARACFLGCRTADRYSNGGFAQSFADRQGVPAYGFPDTSGFSSSPSGRSYWYVLGLGGQNLYMTNRDGRPAVRKDPTKPR